MAGTPAAEGQVAGRAVRPHLLFVAFHPPLLALRDKQNAMIVHPLKLCEWPTVPAAVNMSLRKQLPLHCRFT